MVPVMEKANLVCQCNHTDGIRSAATVQVRFFSSTVIVLKYLIDSLQAILCSHVQYLRITIFAKSNFGPLKRDGALTKFMFVACAS